MPTVTSGDVLELACGTGLFTQRLARTAHRLTAMDASAAVLAINAERVGDPRVAISQADIFAWEPPARRRYDHIFFGFFLSHVPPHLLDGFWERLGRWLAPGGRVWFCDDAPGVDGGRRTRAAPWRTARRGRTAATARRPRVHDREGLPRARRRSPHGSRPGWHADIAATGDEFIFGSASPAAAIR